MSEFSRLDRAIDAAEREYLKAANAEEEFMDIFISSKRRAALDKMDVKDCTWDEVELKNEMNQPKEKHYFKKTNTLDQKNDQGVSDPSSEEMLTEAYILISKIKYHKNITPEITSKIEQVESLLSKLDFREPTESPQIPEEEISSQPEISVSKSDNMIVEGFATSNILDSQGHIINMNVVKKALTEYLDHGTLMLGHGNRPVGRIFDYTFRKTDSGHDGLYIRAKLFKGCEDVAAEIGKTINAFSIGGYAVLKENCQKAQCHKDIINLKLFEVSLVPRGANKECLIEM